MSGIKDLHIIDLYNDEDLEIVKRVDTSIYENMLEVRNKYDRDEYNKLKEQSIINVDYLVRSDDDGVFDFYRVQIEKDKRSANIYPIICSSSKLIVNITNSLLDSDKMEEVFVFVSKNDTKKLNSLLKNEFISLSTDDESQYIPLVKENNNDIERSRVWK